MELHLWQANLSRSDMMGVVGGGKVLQNINIPFWYRVPVHLYKDHHYKEDSVK